MILGKLRRQLELLEPWCSKTSYSVCVGVRRGRVASKGMLRKQGAHYLGLYMNVGNERPLVGVMVRFGTLA